MADLDPTPPSMAGAPDALVAMHRELVTENRGPLARALPAVYDELRALAGKYFSEQPSGHTLQPTALVHEVYAKLAGGSAEWSDREHFLALAATVMRQVLADHARGRNREKRGGEWKRVPVSVAGIVDDGGTDDAIDLVALEAALCRLEALDERQARIVELRFMASLTIDEIARVLSVSRRTVELDWRVARAWLRRELAGAQDS